MQWKRTNLIFTTYATATFSILIIEFSFWDDFGTYIWFVIIGFDPETTTDANVELEEAPGDEPRLRNRVTTPERPAAVRRPVEYDRAL